MAIPIGNPNLEKTGGVPVDPSTDGRFGQATSQVGAAGILDPNQPPTERESDRLTREAFDLIEGDGAFDAALANIERTRSLKQRQLSIIKDTLDTSPRQRRHLRRMDRALGAKGLSRQMLEMKIELGQLQVDNQAASAAAGIRAGNANLLLNMSAHARTIEAEGDRNKAADLIEEMATERGMAVNKSLLHRYRTLGEGDPTAAMIPPASNAHMQRRTATWSNYYNMALKLGPEAATKHVEQAVKLGEIHMDAASLINAAIASGGEMNRILKDTDLAQLSKAQKDALTSGQLPRYYQAGEFTFVDQPGHYGEWVDDLHVKAEKIIKQAFVDRAPMVESVKRIVQQFGLGGSDVETIVPAIRSLIFAGGEENREVREAFVDAHRSAMRALVGPESSPALASIIASIYPEIWADLSKDESMIGLLRSSNPADPGAEFAVFLSEMEGKQKTVDDFLARREEQAAAAAAAESNSSAPE
jgi:hypothetical protein